MCLAQIDCEKSDVNTCLTLLHRVRLGSGLTGSSLVSVAAKPLWFVAIQCDSVSWSQIDEQKSNVNGRKCISTLVMVFHRFRIEVNRVFFAKCFCQVALPCHPT